jgi:hypothetical protein
MEFDDNVKQDVARLQELDKALEENIKMLGKEDPMVLSLKARVDAARAAQWSAKPIGQRLQRSQRKVDGLARAIEREREARAELERQRADIVQKVEAADEKIEQLLQDQERARQELGELLDKAKAEKGCSSSEHQPKPSDGDEAIACLAKLQSLFGARVCTEEMRVSAEQLLMGIKSFMRQLPEDPVAAPGAATGAVAPPHPPPPCDITNAPTAGSAAAGPAEQQQQHLQQPQPQQPQQQLQTQQATPVLPQGAQSGAADCGQVPHFTIDDAESDAEDADMVQRDDETAEAFCTRMRERKAKRAAAKLAKKAASAPRKPGSTSATSAAGSSSSSVIGKSKGQSAPPHLAAAQPRPPCRVPHWSHRRFACNG